MPSRKKAAVGLGAVALGLGAWGTNRFCANFEKTSIVPAFSLGRKPEPEPSAKVDQVEMVFKSPYQTNPLDTITIIVVGGNGESAKHAYRLAKQIRDRIENVELQVKNVSLQYSVCGIKSNPNTYHDNAKAPARVTSPAYAKRDDPASVTSPVESALQEYVQYLYELISPHVTKVFLFGYSLGGHVASLLGRLLVQNKKTVLAYWGHNTFSDLSALVRPRLGPFGATLYKVCHSHFTGWDTVANLEKLRNDSPETEFHASCTKIFAGNQERVEGSILRRLGGKLGAGDLLVPCASSQKLRTWIEENNLGNTYIVDPKHLRIEEYHGELPNLAEVVIVILQSLLKIDCDHSKFETLSNVAIPTAAESGWVKDLKQIHKWIVSKGKIQERDNTVLVGSCSFGFLRS